MRPPRVLAALLSALLAPVLSPVLSIGAILAATTHARAQTADAGPDQALAFPMQATLAGVVVNGTPLDWWTADGNNATENFVIEYSSVSGFSYLGPLRNSAGGIYGYPTDLLRISTRVYGVDANRRQIYTLNVTTGIVAPIGAPWTSAYFDVQSLAHDPVLDRLYAIDRPTSQLLVIDRVTGVPTPIGSQTLSAWPELRSLAWRAADAQLYAVDQTSNQLVRIDPTNGAGTVAAFLNAHPEERIEELQFVGDELYAVNALLPGGVMTGAELQHIDLSDGSAEIVGPEVTDVSAHSLLINSLPEATLWSQVSGPATAAISDPFALAPTVTFPQAGAYVLRFTVFGASGEVADDVTVVQDGCPNDPNKIEPGTCGCGVADADGDLDGFADCVDNCDAVINPDQVDADGDGDGDACDNCPSVANPGQEDCDADLLGDACEIAGGAPDCNYNGVPDECDLAHGASADVNANLVPDECESPSGAAYCFGDGSGTPCPCSNDAALGSGTGCVNSTGHGAAMTSSGVAQILGDSLALSASGMPPNVLCVLFQGRANAAGGAGAVFGDGLRCVQANLIRVFVHAASPTGTLDYPRPGDPAISIKGQVPVGGALRYYQLVHRNFVGPCGGALNGTNGIAVAWTP